jgi:parvulin-like peptidyl-prolyl isomerase
VKLRAFALLIPLALLTSCGPTVAARVGAETIATVDLQREIDTMRTNDQYASYLAQTTGRDALRDENLLPVLVLDVLTTQITEVLLSEEVARTKLRITSEDRAAGALDASAATGRPSIIAALPSWYRETLQRRATMRAALRRTLTDSETVEDYYERNREEFVRPCTRHILVRTRSDAAAARMRIVAGEWFADVAKDVSIDRGSAPKGGDLGCNGREDLRPELNKAALSQPLGRVSEAIHTEQGYQLLLVESRDVPPLDEVRGEVRGAIGRLGDTRLEQALRRRARATKIEVSPDIGRWNGERVVPR